MLLRTAAVASARFRGPVVTVGAVPGEPYASVPEFRVLLDALEEGVVVQDARGRIAFANPAAERILGLTFGQMTGLTSHDPRWEATFEDGTPAQGSEHPAAIALRTGRPSDDVIMSARHADGSTVWMTVRARPLFADDEQNVPTGVVISFTDISQLREQREREAQAAHRYETLLANMSDLVSVIDAHGVMSYVSPVTEPLLGRNADTRVGRSIFENVHPDDLGATVERLARARQVPGQMMTFETRVRHEDGTYRVFEVVANNLLHDPHVQGVILTSRDVTVRREIEASLREAEQRFELVFERAAVGMNIVSPKGEFLRVNAAYCRLVGYDAQQLLSMTIFDLTAAEDLEQTHLQYQRLVSGEIDEYQIDKMLQRDDGSCVWVRISASMVRDTHGEPLYAIGQVVDITDTMELTERLAHEANHDHLTGLPTRPKLYEMLDRSLMRARRDEGGVAALVIDLDFFKRVNDTHGHPAGDDVLIATARRLEALVRFGDIVARLGGDEFVIAIAPVHHPSLPEDVARRVVASLAEPIAVGGTFVTVGASVGIAVSMDGERTADRLLAAADRAAYRAKAQGRGTFVTTRE